MSLQYNSVYVDEKYSPLVEKVLGYKNPFIPGVTCNDVHQVGQAGQIFVHKPGTSAQLYLINNSIVTAKFTVFKQQMSLLIK